jgi:hypothetical protein
MDIPNTSPDFAIANGRRSPIAGKVYLHQLGSVLDEIFGPDDGQPPPVLQRPSIEEVRDRFDRIIGDDLM